MQLKYPYLFFLMSFAYGQKAVVCSDSPGHAPVAFSNIKYRTEGKAVGGQYANENGVFNLAGRKMDSIEVSAVGFRTRKINRNSVKDTVWLSPEVYQLQEVVVRSKGAARQQFAEVGNAFSGKTLYQGASLGFEIVDLLVPAPSDTGAIQRFIFRAKVDSDKQYRSAVRIVFYANENGGPARETSDRYKSDVIFIDNGKKQDIEVDVSQLDIRLPADGIFAGIEWLGFLNKETGEFADLEQDSQQFYTGIGLKEEKKQAASVYTRSKFGNYNWSELVDEQTLATVYRLDAGEVITPAYRLKVVPDKLAPKK